MSTDTYTPVDAAFDDLLTIDAATADLLFKEARTVVKFDDGDVSDAQVQAAYDLVRWGPTMMNTVPLRLLLVRSPEARERLVAHMGEGNRPKTLAAPLTIIAAADPAFHERMDVLAPHVEGARDLFEGYGAEARVGIAAQSALIQIGYLTVGLRAAGLHVGPMGGFDKDAVDAEFFGESGWKTQLIINVGTPAAEGASYPRQTRLSFDEVSTSV